MVDDSDIALSGGVYRVVAVATPHAPRSSGEYMPASDGEGIDVANGYRGWPYPTAVPKSTRGSQSTKSGSRTQIASPTHCKIMNGATPL